MHKHRLNSRALTALIALALLISVGANYGYGQPLTSAASAAPAPPANVAANHPQMPAVPNWSAPVLVSQGASTARGPGLAMNQGEAAVDFDYGPSSGPVLYGAISSNNGHSFGPGIFTDCGTDGIPAGTPVQAAEGSDRYVYFLWQASCDANVYRTLWLNIRNPQGAWLGAHELTNFDTDGSSIAVGPDGSVHVVYVKVTTSGPGGQTQVFYIKSTNHGSTFSAPFALTDDRSYTNTTTVTVDTNGHVHAVYEYGTFNSYQLYARESIQGVWQAAIQIYSGRGFWPHLAATSDGRVGVVWQENDTGVQVYYKRWTPSGGWDPIATNVSNNDTGNFNPSSAYDAAGNAYISWTVADGTGTLFVYSSYEISPGVFSTPQQVENSRSVGISQASWNNNIGIAYQYDGSGAWQVYFRWIQLSAPPTATPTRTPTPRVPTPTPTFCANQTFVDVNCSYWAFTYVEAMNNAQIINGYSASSSQCVTWHYVCYLPRNLVTRAEVTKMLARAESWPSFTPTTPSFTDVPTTYWAYSFIERAVANNVADGLTASQCQAAHAVFPCFLPNSPLTRAQLTKFVYRAHHLAPYTPTSPDFSDVPSTYFAYLYIETAAHNNVVSGYTNAQCAAAHAPNNCFLPNQNVHRDEVAKMVKKMLDVSPPNTPTSTPTNTSIPVPPSDTPPPTSTPPPSTNTPVLTATPTTPATTPTSTPQVVTVSLGDDFYQPQTVTVTVGTVVQWTNNGAHTHTVTSDPSATETFTSGNLTSGQSYSHMFMTVGTDGYHCDFHGGPGSGMFGTVVVVAGFRPDN